MQNKMLVVAPYRCLPTDGGPSGFIAQNMLSHSGDNIVIGRKSTLKGKRSIPERMFYRIEKYLRVDKGVRFTHTPFFYSKWRKCRDYLRSNSYQSYRYLYFHELSILGLCLDMILPEQVVLVQPHAPEILSFELKSIWGDKIDEASYRSIDMLCERAFEAAHHIVLPHDGTLDIYRSQIADTSKINYLLSASNDRSLSLNSPVELNKDKLNYLYIGRRNDIKGFNLVIGAFRKAIKHRKDIHLYLVGSGDPVSEEGITDVGFSEHPGLWMKSVDFLMNANRVSYLDLSIMEALSLGTRIVMTTTFGHSFFKTFINDESLFEIDGSEKSIKSFFINSKKPMQKFSKFNRDIYEAYFSQEIYHQRLNKLVADIFTE